MKALKVPAGLLLMAAVSPLATGCAAVPPSGPSIVALPQQGKDLAQFQREDAACREYAATRITPPNASGKSSDQLQQAYNIAYAQCMATNGDNISPIPISYGPAYAYPDPWYWDPWHDPGFGVSFIGFGSRFHHHAFPHRGGFEHVRSGGHRG
ncbi:MAG TPA: hypothetical protein VGC09_04910 [Rhodopila sp.]